MTTSDLALYAGALEGLDDASDELLERLLTAGDGGVVLLCDNSSSMCSPVKTKDGYRMHMVRAYGRSVSQPMSRHAALVEALAPLRELGRVIMFSDSTSEVSPTGSIPEPSGTTNVAGAIHHATRLSPTRTILISDGEPNSADAAFQAAKSLPGILETIFIGNDSDAAAKDFMRKIATQCGGDFDDLSGGTSEGLAPVLARKLLPP